VNPLPTPYLPIPPTPDWLAASQVYRMNPAADPAGSPGALRGTCTLMGGRSAPSRGGAVRGLGDGPPSALDPFPFVQTARPGHARPGTAGRLW